MADEQGAPAWLREAVMEGMQRLVALHLPGQPPAETVVLTAEAWVEALWAHGPGWCEADAQRLRAAFVALLAQVERWPAPRHLIAAMPARAHVVTLAPPTPSASQRAATRAMLADLAQRLRSEPARPAHDPHPPHPASSLTREGPRRADAPQRQRP